MQSTNPISAQTEIYFTEPFSFEVHSASARMDIGMSLAVTFIYRDDSLYDASIECWNRLFPALVQQQEAEIADIVPVGPVTLRVGPLTNQYIGMAARTLPMGTWALSYRFKVTSRMKWVYYTFPFDPQNVVINFWMKNPELRVSKCHASSVWVTDTRTFANYRANTTDPLSLESMRSAILPQEWWLDQGDAVKPMESWLIAAEPDPLMPAGIACMTTIRLRRNPMVYIVKSLTLDILIVIAGITAVLINPSVPPQMGARCGLMMTAMLMTINKSARRELGLGPIGYMMVLDWLAVFNVLILLVMLLETLIIHYLLNKKRTSLASTIDRSFGIMAPSLYLLTLIGFLIAFQDRSDVVGGYAAGVIFLLVLCMGIHIGMTMRARLRRLKAAAAKLIAGGALSVDPAAREAALQEVFANFDSNSNGTLEADEVRVLLRALKPRLHKSKRTESLDLDGFVRRLSIEGKEGGVTLKQLSELIESLVAIGDGSSEVVVGSLDEEMVSTVSV